MIGLDSFDTVNCQGRVRNNDVLRNVHVGVNVATYMTSNDCIHVKYIVSSYIYVDVIYLSRCKSIELIY